ncbi:MAG: flavodoxin-dependent (E)-4-hydroxy-3-methylbut-2-enyl-diphosphate synthase [Candidatus Omnitrophica bacterium]|nr:flavodoxin-dependent (E)-4-hydroxy-3-methylbut-2-enyl-diphosphate synthase [Candidatus Omnitrophota bacterium]
MEIKRRKTRIVKVGSVKIGGNNPIVIQSMAKTDTRNTTRTISEILKLEKSGCEIVRVAVKDLESARALRAIKERVSIPLVADIHFDYRLALESLESGADKIRINPGNIPKPVDLRQIIRAAGKRKIPIRIGINSGSLPYHIAHLGGDKRVAGLVSFARKYINFFEKEKFRDIIISIKSSSVYETVRSYRKLAAFCDYPFHVGVTAAGPYNTGIVKSSIGAGALLLDGIGDTIRVSLTGDPRDEVIAAKRILQSLDLRRFDPDIISCPTCGRCQVDLAGIVKQLEGALSHNPSLVTRDGSRITTIAVMGCEVNGPGEAREADVGVAFGRDSGTLFKKGKIVKRIKAKNAVRELLKYIRDFKL